MKLKTKSDCLFYIQVIECNTLLYIKNLRESKPIRDIQTLNPIIVVVE